MGAELVVGQMFFFFLILMGANYHLDPQRVIVRNDYIENERRQLKAEIVRLNEQNVALTSELSSLRYR